MLWFAQGSTSCRKALSAATIALEISSRNARVAALQKTVVRAGLDFILHQRGADMADLLGGASRLLVRDYRGKEADVLVTRSAPGVVSLVAELRGHERQAAEELGQWKTGGDQARPAADRRGVGLVGEGRWRWRNREGRTIRRVRCPKPSTARAPWRACPSIPRQRRGPRRATADGWRDLRGAPKVLGPAARRPGSDLAATRRGLVAVPGGASGLLCRDYKGKEADQLITRIDPGVVSLVAELRGHERQADLRGTGPVESSRRGSASPSTRRRRRLRWRC
jgi:hypothetical protein